MSLSHYRLAEQTTFPARWFDGLLRALPGVHDLVVTVALRVIFRKLNASPGASGPHAFAVRTHVTRLVKCTRPSHPAPRFVTIAIRPLVEAG
jgi:hypothetical protein